MAKGNMVCWMESWNKKRTLGKNERNLKKE